jgi:manganese/iron transport system substrate-binding protein
MTLSTVLRLSALLACLWSAAALAQPKVVTTFSILADLTERVAGEAVEVVSLTPIGAEVHDWALTPNNFMALESADLVLYNGYQLEQWMSQVRTATRRQTPLVAVAEQAEWPTLPILIGEFASAPDPHLWMDPRAGAAYGWVIAEALTAIAPDDAETFRLGARALETELLTLHDELLVALHGVAPERRVLITSESAFHYFAQAYGYAHDGIWGTNTETEGTPRQLMRIIDRVRQLQPAAVFWESTLSDRYVRQVAEDTGVAVAGPLYVDSLGAAGSGAEDYFSMLRHNVRVITEALNRD